MSGYDDDDPYIPATRPPGNIPGGKRVRFEREGEHEQSIFGGGAQDIEASILKTTERNLQIIGWRIVKVTDVVGEMGAGTLQKLSLELESGGQKRIMTIHGVGMEVEFS